MSKTQTKTLDSLAATGLLPTEQQQNCKHEFAEFLKPRLAELLRGFRLDVLFHRASGDYLYYLNDEGKEVEVLDLVGGFGASLLGHNHPELVSLAQRVLAQGLPFNAQASVRSYASRLAQVLSSRIGRFTGRSYVVTLASTGTEAVEAAIKHAALEKWRSNDRILRELNEDIARLRLRLKKESAFVSPALFESAANLLGESKFDSLEAVLEKLEAVARKVVETEPRFLAIAGAFHGKSTGSLQLTYREEFRKPWQGLGVRVSFVEREDVTQLDQLVRESTVTLPRIRYDSSGYVVLEPRTVTNISACFCEPIQGEGGVYELSPTFMTALRRIADEGNFPLILDEIQSGMGRSGSFLASESSGVRGDYYLLSKSLGGGLAKISALLIDRARYETDFSYLHTSTFADDDFSSAIALGVMEVLERDGGAIIEQCRKKGDALIAELKSLQERFPQQVLDVRGRGLMIGIELAPQVESSSPLLRVLSEQNLLSYLAAGYLLHEYGIRIAPTLGRQTVLRVEPSAYISDAACKKFCHALEHFLIRLRDHDVGHLMSFVVGRTSNGRRKMDQETIRPSVVTDRSTCKANGTRIAFLVHFSAPTDLQNWEQRLGFFSEADCAAVLDRTRSVFRPFVLHQTNVKSKTGDEVNLTVIHVPFTAEQAIESLRSGDDWCFDLVKEAVDLARDLGCTVIGLGGHTSIVSDSGRRLIHDDLALTSGNSLSVAVAYELLVTTAKRIGLDPATCRLGVVGAAGNIGATLAELAIDDVEQLLLFGRQSAERFLRSVAERMCVVAFDRVVAGTAKSGIARTIANSEIAHKALAGRIERTRLGAELFAGLNKEMGREAPIQVRSAMEDLRSCELVISATNSPRPVIGPAHLRDGPVVVCDVAVPCDVDRSVESQCPQAVVLRGGLVRAPLGQELNIPGLPLQGSDLYGCLGETILLGFTGTKEHYSYGPLSISHIHQIRDWAVTHGFETVDRPCTESH